MNWKDDIEKERRVEEKYVALTQQEMNKGNIGAARKYSKEVDKSLDRQEMILREQEVKPSLLGRWLRRK